MKKYTLIGLFCMTVAALQAIPAYRGWQTKTQPDGTTLQVRLNGDEFYHYYTNEQGEVLSENADGYWQVVEKSLSADTIAARRAKSPLWRTRRAKQDIGTINLAPRGLLILVNFSDTIYQSSNPRAEMDSMMNGQTYTYGNSYGSARQYFYDQSNGAYSPQFDVVGPVTLPKKHSYYGKNQGGEEGNDMYPGDMIVEACQLAKSECNVDFSKYDNDNDGYVDFVYVIYAGKGEADGGATTTIWPHNWNIESTIYYGKCTYKKSDCLFDGKYIDNYACSGEISGITNLRNGIGTFCHEFGHVLGLPDYYDTEYGTNYEEYYTPCEWDIMDMGCYNAEGDCPPNYSAHEKYFFGWATPVNPGTKAGTYSLTAESEPLQINAAGILQAATREGVNYYLENRQQSGWDKYLPGHGLLVWYVNYSASAWKNNEPNNTAGSPRYTIISAATGNKTNVGTASDAYPGTKNKTTWSSISTKPVKDIAETDGVITFTYIEQETAPTVMWVVDGTAIETKTYRQGDTLVLPTAAVAPCEGMQFLGWTTEKDWRDPFVLPADLFNTAEGKTITTSVTYYALFE